jgi:tape measure domain-containing protein
MNVGSLNIELIANLAKLQNDMDKANKTVDTAMRGIDKSVGIAKKAFAGLAGSIGAGAIMKFADEYKRFDSQLKLATKTVTEYEAAYAKVVSISRTSQSDIGAIGVLYARLTNNLREFKTSQKDIGTITESVALSLRVSNATVQETNSVMLQLSQSFGSGRINGQEFLAVSEGAPIIMRQLAKSLNVTYGALKEMSAQGKLTSETLKTALTDPEYLKSLQEQVKQVGTISSAMTVFTNNLKVFIGETDKAAGASKVLANSIIFLGDHLNAVANLALAGFIVYLSKSVAAFNAKIAANVALRRETLITATLEKEAAQATAIQDTLSAEKSIGMDKLKVISKIRVLEAKQLEAAESVKVAAGTAAEVNASKVLEAQTYKLIIAKGQLAKLNGAVGVSLANNAAASSKLAYEQAKVASNAAAVAKAVGIKATAMRGLAVAFAAVGGWFTVIIAGLTGIYYWFDRINSDRQAERFGNAIDGVRERAKELQKQVALGITPDNIFAKEIANVKELEKARDGLFNKLQLQEKNRRAGNIFAVSDADFKQTSLEYIQSIKDIENAQKDLSFSVQQYNDKEKATAQVSIEAIKDLKTKSELAAEYKKRIEEVTKASIANGDSDAVRAERIALVTAEYEKSVGITKQNKAAMKELTEAQKEYDKALKDSQESNAKQIQTMFESIEAAQKELETIERNIAVMNSSEEATARSEVARLREAIAAGKQGLEYAKLNGATAEQIQFTEEAIQQLEKLAETRDKVINAKAVEDSLKAEKEKADDAIKEAERANNEIIKDAKRKDEEIRKSLTDALLRGFESGKSFSENFKETLENLFKTMVLRPVISAVLDASGLSKIAGAVGSIVGGNALAGESGSGGGLGDIGSIFKGLTQGFDNAGMALTNSIGDFGSWVGGFGEAGGAIESFGKLISNNNVLIGQASSFIGAGISLLKGDIKGAASQGAGAGLGLLLSGGNPIGGAIGSMLGGMIGGMFGGGLPPRITASRSGVFSGGKFAASEGLDKGKRKIGGESSLDNLNEVFSKQLGTLFSAFNVNQAIGTNSLLTKKKNVRARFNASIGGTQLAGYEQSFGKKGDFNVALQEMVNNALGAVTVQAIQASSLSSGIKSIFDGMTKKEEVSALINSVINLNKAQKELAKNFGITVDQSAQAAKATGLMGAALAGYVDKLTSAALATRTIGDALIGARTNILDVMGNALGAVSTQAVTSLVARQVQKTVPATAVGSSRQSGFGFSGTAITGFLSFVKPMMQTVTETVYDSVTEYVDTVTPIAAELPTSLKGFDELLKSINKNSAAGIKQFNDLFAIRDQFIQFTKAMDGLKGNVRGALFSMVSDAEKRKMLNEDLAKLFGDFGRTVPASIDELIALGKSIDYTTAEGLNLASVFPTLVDAFNKTKSAVDSLVESLRDASTFKTLIDFRRYQGIARNYGAEFANQRWDNIASYDTGTSYVPKDGMAMIHEGEAVLTKSQNASITHDSSTIVSELKALRTEVTNLRYSADRTAIHSKRAADVLVNVSPNGDAIQTELAA